MVYKKKTAFSVSDEGVQRFAIYLIETRHARDAVIFSEENPTRKAHTRFRKEILLRLITDTGIHNYAAEHWSNKDTVTVDDLVGFFRSRNFRSTQNLGHEYIPWMIQLFCVDVDGYTRMPFMLQVPKELRPREEAVYSYTICEYIRHHPFLGKFAEALPEFQQKMGPTSGFIYDLMWPHLRIVAEVQEDKKNHDEKEEDLDKYASAMVHGFMPIYIKMAELEGDQLFAVQRNLRMMEEKLTNAILYFVPKSVYEYAVVNFVNASRVRMKVLSNKEYIYEEVKKAANAEVKAYAELIGRSDANSIVRQIMKAKTQPSITVDFILKMMRADSSNRVKILNEVYRIDPIGDESNTSPVLSWSQTLRFFMNTHLCRAEVSRVLADFVISIGDTYENVMDRIRAYSNELLAMRDEVRVTGESLIKRRLEKVYRETIRKLEEHNMDLTEEVHALRSSTENFVRGMGKVEKLLDKIPTGRQTAVQTIKDARMFIEEIQKTPLRRARTAPRFTNLKPVFEDGASLAPSVSGFPIQFINDSRFYLRMPQIRMITRSFNLPDGFRRAMIQRLGVMVCHSVDGEPQILHRVRIAPAFEHVYGKTPEHDDMGCPYLLGLDDLAPVPDADGDTDDESDGHAEGESEAESDCDSYSDF